MNTNEPKLEAYIGIKITVFSDGTHVVVSTSQAYETATEAIDNAKDLPVFSSKYLVLCACYSTVYPSGTVGEINKQLALNKDILEAKTEIADLMGELYAKDTLQLKPDDIAGMDKSDVGFNVSDVHEYDIPFAISGLIRVPAKDGEGALEQVRNLSEERLRDAVSTAISNGGYGFEEAEFIR